MRKAATVKDVAVKAGVSPATVSNVLGSRKKVNADMAARVHAAAAELGYEADRAASFLRSGQSRIVAMMVPSLDNPFFTSIIASVERWSNANGFDLIVASSNGSDAVEKARVGALLSWRPAGVVVIPSSERFPARDALDFSGTPYVVADRAIPGLAADAVTIDNEMAGRRAADHLVALGHRAVTICASTLELSNIRERCDGIRGRLAEAEDASLSLLEVGMTFESASARIEDWLQGSPRTTAVVALTNFSTLAVLGALVQRHIRVPDDVSLVGFDDYAWMRAAGPSVTAIRQPVEEIGHQIWERLQARMDGDQGEPVHIRLDTDLVVRNSTLGNPGPAHSTFIRSADGAFREEIRNPG